MSSFIRPGSGLLVLVLALGLLGFGLSWAGWARVEAARHQPPAEEMEVLAPTTEEGEVLQRRIRAKAQVVDRLVAGELTLVEAAAWFHFLNSHPAPAHEAYLRAIPGRSVGEKSCRQVLTWAECRLRGRVPDSQRAALLGELRDELDRLLARGGPIELPW